MLSGKERKLLVCKTLTELSDEEAAITKSVKRQCLECGTTIWVVPRNLIITSEVVCLRCATKLAHDTKEEVKVHMAKPFADILHKIESN